MRPRVEIMDNLFMCCKPCCGLCIVTRSRFDSASVLAGTGGLVTDDWQQFAWPKIRYLETHFKLQPWYSDTNAFLASVAAQQQDAVRARITADAAAAKEAAAAAAAAAANPALNLATITETVVPVRAAGDTDTSSSGSRASSKAGVNSPSSSAVGADLLPAATPSADATAVAQPVQAAQTDGSVPGHQGGTGDAASYVQFDVQPPPAIVAAGAGGAASSKSAAAAAAGSSIKQLNQAVKPPALMQHVDTHANLPAPVFDLDDTPGSAMLLDVPADVEEEQLSVPATVQEVPV
jgi:hypothetical protein